jgi:precorrin-2 dehydrogenase/sirohydrochlorin ferrochelatase
MLLPVALNLEGRHVLVVGGGKVASRKVESLLECGAVVRAISTRFTLEFPDCEKEYRAYQFGDCEGYFLVFAATDDREVNARIAQEAKNQNIWCNVVDNPASSDFHSASVVRRDEIAIGVTTGRTSPVLAQYVRKKIESALGPELGILLEWMRSYDIPTEIRGDVWRELLQSEVIALLGQGETEAARTKLSVSLHSKFGLQPISGS